MRMLSREDRQKLEKQLAELHAHDRALAQLIADARAQGDLRENADYHAAREDKAHNDMKIRQLEEMLQNSQVVDAASLPKDMIYAGATITIHDEATGKTEVLRMVTMINEEAEIREVTDRSPMGSALMRARVGDVVRVTLPKGERRIRVVEIFY